MRETAILPWRNCPASPSLSASRVGARAHSRSIPPSCKFHRAPGGASPPSTMPRAGLKWDEANLAANEEEKEAARAAGERTKILEPKTPFHRLGEDGEEPEAWPPKAPAAVAGGKLAPGITPQNSSAAAATAGASSPQAYQENTLQPGMHDLSALTASALERREQPPELVRRAPRPAARLALGSGTARTLRARAPRALVCLPASSRPAACPHRRRTTHRRPRRRRGESSRRTGKPTTRRAASPSCAPR